MSGLNRIGKVAPEPTNLDPDNYAITKKKRGPKLKFAESTMEAPFSKEELALFKSFEHLRSLLAAEIEKENLSRQELIHRLAHSELRGYLVLESERIRRGKAAKKGGRRTLEIIDGENIIRAKISEMSISGVPVNLKNIKERLDGEISVEHFDYQIKKIHAEYKRLLANDLDLDKA
jgi:hypothetical protein